MRGLDRKMMRRLGIETIRLDSGSVLPVAAQGVDVMVKQQLVLKAATQQTPPHIHRCDPASSVLGLPSLAEQLADDQTVLASTSAINALIAKATLQLRVLQGTTGQPLPCGKVRKCWPHC